MNRRVRITPRAALASVLGVVCLAVALSATTAFGTTKHVQAHAADANTLVVAIPEAGNYASLGWMMNADDKALWSVTSDPIMARNPKTWALTGGGLVDRWTHSADYTNWTFDLRKGVQWQGGYGELTADDFVYTVQRILQPGATGSAATFFQQNLASVSAANKYSVVMKFKTGQFQLPRQISYAPFTIMSKAYVTKVGDAAANATPIGTGPYQFVSSIPGQQYVFKAFPQHWGGVPQFKNLIIKIVPDPATALAGLESGEIDIAPMSGDLLKQGLASGLKLHEAPKSAEVALLLGGVTPKGTPDYCPSCAWVGDQSNPASAKRARLVREAMTLAINRKAIIQAVFAGYADLTPFVFYWYPQAKGWSKSWAYSAYNLAKAKALMKQAGYPNGFTIQLNPDTNPTYGPDIISAVAQYWAQIGITVKQVPEQLSTYQAKLAARNTDDTGWGVLTTAYIFDDPVTAWANTMSSTAPNGEIMPEFYDKQVAEGNATTNQAARLKIEEAIANSLQQNYWVMNIAFADTTWLTTKRIGSWTTLVGYTYTNGLQTVTKAK